MLEGALRIAAPQPLSMPALEPSDGILIPRPNMSGRDYMPGDFDVQVTTNSMRLRGSREYALEPGPAARRILVLGDSFTYGVGAADDDTYPAQLEGILAVDPGGSWEVLNAGIYGSGPGEQILYYERWASRFQPSVVVLTLYENDLRDDRARPAFFVESGQIRPRAVSPGASRQNAARSLTRRVPGYTYLSQHSHLLSLVRQRAGSLLRPAPARPAPSRASAAPSASLKSSYELLDLELAHLAESVRARGGRLGVVVVAPRFVIHKTRDSSAFEAFVAAAQTSADRHQIPFRDLSPALLRAQEEGTRLYFERDFHCTPAGYGVLAAEVADFLSDEGLLAPALPRAGK
tara:strand:- start:953 stop:1993 length:1041 start_codon:yes stop_codon:yes gene_type:complete